MDIIIVAIIGVLGGLLTALVAGLLALPRVRSEVDKNNQMTYQVLEERIDRLWERVDALELERDRLQNELDLSRARERTLSAKIRRLEAAIRKKDRQIEALTARMDNGEKPSDSYELPQD